MTEKMTVAKRNEILRDIAFEKIIKENSELLQIAGSKYALDIEFKGEFYPVRIDFVVPKINAEDGLQTAQDMHEDYVNQVEEKRLDKEQKALAKAKKIARDTKNREEMKAAKEAAKAKKVEA